MADLQLAASQLSEARKLRLDIYTKRTGASRETVGGLMRLTSFLKPDDALQSDELKSNVAWFVGQRLGPQDAFQ